MPVRYPRVLIVDAPTSTAKVLYDFQDDTQPLDTGSKTALHSQDWSFGNLELLGDPDAVGVDWGLRQVSFTQEISGTKSAALARQALMSKALLRRRFWLKFQLTAATTAVYWNGYRTPPGALSLEQVYADGPLMDRWEIAGSIDLDPFSAAARVTQPAKTIGNNPANDASAPSSGFNLPTIKGDSPAPLRLKLTPDAGNADPGGWLVACVASNRSAPFIAIPVGTSDGLAGNIPTATNSAALGGNLRSGNRTSIGTQPYLRFVAPPSGTVLRTRYLVLARVTGTTGTTVKYQLQNPFAGGTPIGGPTTTTFADANFQWLPLGVVANGSGLPDDIASADASTALTVDIAMDATNAGDTVGIDHLILVPIDGDGIASATVLLLDFPYSPTSTYPCWVDGDSEIAWLGGFPNSAYPITTKGGFPVVDPAAAYNSLLVLPRKNNGSTTTSSTRLAATTSVVASYLPRSSWIGDGAT